MKCLVGYLHLITMLDNCEVDNRFVYAVESQKQSN